MYKVVLVDDEAIILEGLKKVVDWRSFGCEVVALARSASEGAAALRAHKPDILITDIKMPGGDGLTMLAGLRSEFPDMQIAILTGYPYFEYAQQAVRLGVCRLLLKPSKMSEISEALSAMTRALGGADGTEASTSGAAGSFIVKEAVAYITEHHAEKLSLQEVADHCYVSQWHLSKLLNKTLEKNFYDILNEVRITRAKQLLAEPGFRIGDIVELVGYSDPGHFSRIFKKLCGMSANEYRNTL
ncbi:MAG: response regulator [Clostridia bacterium]|nr:response regulator [Clostridia bacterium]